MFRGVLIGSIDSSIDTFDSISIRYRYCIDTRIDVFWTSLAPTPYNIQRGSFGCQNSYYSSSGCIHHWLQWFQLRGSSNAIHIDYGSFGCRPLTTAVPAARQHSLRRLQRHTPFNSAASAAKIISYAAPAASIWLHLFHNYSEKA